MVFASHSCVLPASPRNTLQDNDGARSAEPSQLSSASLGFDYIIPMACDGEINEAFRNALIKPRHPFCSHHLFHLGLSLLPCITAYRWSGKLVGAAEHPGADSFRFTLPTAKLCRFFFLHCLARNSIWLSARSNNARRRERERLCPSVVGLALAHGRRTGEIWPSIFSTTAAHRKSGGRVAKWGKRPGFRIVGIFPGPVNYFRINWNKW